MKKRNSSQVGKRSSSQAAKPQSPKSAEKKEVCDICLKKPATTQVPGFPLYLCDECLERRNRNRLRREGRMFSELLGEERSAQVAHLVNQNGGKIQGFMRSAVDHFLDYLNPDAANHSEGMKEPISNRDAGANHAEATLPAAPSGKYLAMVRARCVHRIPGNRLKPYIYLNLPGLSGGEWTLPGAFEFMAAELHFCAKELHAGLLPVLGSAWERIELEELLLIGRGVAGDGGTTSLADSFAAPVAELYTRESAGVLGQMEPTGAELVSFVAFTLHYHSAAICERVIPQMEVGRAVALIEALVIAEKIVWLLTDPKQDVLGTIESPTELQRRAWELTARLWQEWPRDVDFCVSIEPKPAAVETYLQKMAEVAA